MRAYGLRVHLARDGGRRPQLPATASAALAGALHEALTNVLRHSGVQSCSVTLSATAVSCELAVRDTGRGFPVTDIDGRLGINGSIVARLAEVGGAARIESEPGVGTTVHLRWPVE
jgi:signal transduction histidine kinase